MTDTAVADKPTEVEHDVIDMDAARAARREVRNINPTVKFGGKLYILPIELPMTVVEVFGKPDLSAADVLVVIKLFLDDQYDQFMSNNPSADDCNVFIDGLMKSYGTSVGKSDSSG